MQEQGCNIGRFDQVVSLSAGSSRSCCRAETTAVCLRGHPGGQHSDSCNGQQAPSCAESGGHEHSSCQDSSKDASVGMFPSLSYSLS
jgi:hypothetical protein